MSDSVNDIYVHYSASSLCRTDCVHFSNQSFVDSFLLFLCYHGTVQNSAKTPPQLFAGDNHMMDSSHDYFYE